MSQANNLQIEPTTFRTWLRILQRLPNAVLWLLRFPDLGETNLKQTALLWAGVNVANRILFTDVAQKHQHIARARVCDLFLDTPECNAHTTAADVLWSGTPLLTLPRYKYKMCSRMAASILKGALPKSEDGKRAAMDLIASSEEDYEDVLFLYRQYFNDRINTDPEFKLRILQLQGKRLGCFCKPYLCHGDIIKEYLDEQSTIHNNTNRE